MGGATDGNPYQASAETLNLCQGKSQSHERQSTSGDGFAVRRLSARSCVRRDARTQRDVRPHYQALAETLARLPQDELQRRKQSAEMSFLTQGITFTVYGRDEGTERIFPTTCCPACYRGEWDRIERGLTQRITRSTSSSATSTPTPRF